MAKRYRDTDADGGGDYDEYEPDEAELAELYKRRRRLVAVVVATLAVIVMAIATRDSQKPSRVDAASDASRPTVSAAAPAATTSVLGTTANAPPATVPPTSAGAPAATAPPGTVSAADPLTFRMPMQGKVNISLAWDCYNCVDWPTLRGKHHPAVDYVSNDHTIMATADGVVTKMNTGCGGQGCGNSFGNWLFLKHTLPDGSALYSFYAHLASFTPNVVEGACIRQGERVGTMGNTGIASAAHLHFGIQTNTNLLDYTSQSSATFGSRNPETFYGKAKVRPC